MAMKMAFECPKHLKTTRAVRDPRLSHEIVASAGTRASLGNLQLAFAKWTHNALPVDVASGSTEVGILEVE